MLTKTLSSVFVSTETSKDWILVEMVPTFAWPTQGIITWHPGCANRSNLPHVAMTPLRLRASTKKERERKMRNNDTRQCAFSSRFYFSTRVVSRGQCKKVDIRALNSNWREKKKKKKNRRRAMGENREKREREKNAQCALIDACPASHYLYIYLCFVRVRVCVYERVKASACLAKN